MKQTATTTSLTLNGLHLSVFLGIYPEEKIKQQRVHIDAQFRFSEPPSGCQTDRLDDTYCYDKIINYLKTKLAERRFQLLEHLTQTLYELLKAYFPVPVALSLRVTKQPRIPELTQGVTFEYGDEAFAWSS